MLAELLLFSCMLFSYTNKLGVAFCTATGLMILGNGFFIATGGSEFYRLSLVNILFLLLCLVVIFAGYNAHRTHGKKRNERDGYFMARVMQTMEKL